VLTNDLTPKNTSKWIDKGMVAIDPDLFPELLTE
jgi:hypothetical protein